MFLIAFVARLQNFILLNAFAFPLYPFSGSKSVPSLRVRPTGLWLPATAHESPGDPPNICFSNVFNRLCGSIAKFHFAKRFRVSPVPFFGVQVGSVFAGPSNRFVASSHCTRVPWRSTKHLFLKCFLYF